MLKHVYVISDLHLGGKYDGEQRGFRMCTQEKRIAQFIDHLTALNPAVELVINGDFVDFLAEENQAGQWSDLEPDPKEAVRKFRAIVQRNQAVFTALRQFLAAGQRLVITLGNHDLELSYPAVRAALHDELQTHLKDFEFLYDGEGYVLGDVLIEHGNRYDTWNEVDYDALREVRSLQSRFQDTKKYLYSPPGSQLVTNVMNPLKRRYSFLDLLKPELQAAVPLLLALEPAAMAQLAKLSVYFGKQLFNSVHGALPVRSGMVANEDDEEAVQSLYLPLCAAFGGDKAAAKEFYQSLYPVANDGRVNAFSDFLDDARSLVRQWTAKTVADGRRNLLRKALSGLLKGERAGRDKEGYPEYLVAARELTEDGPLRHVVFGHTHHPKKIGLQRGGFYVNTGTWADVLDFPRELLDLSADAHLEEFMRRMAENDLSAWEMFHPTYAHLQIDQGKAQQIDLLDWAG